MIVTEVDRLPRRIWNGNAKNARKSIDRIRAVMHHFRGEGGTRKSNAPSRKLWTVSRELDNYLTGQSAWLVNCAERHREGLRVGTSITEGTANFLVNRRMNKSHSDLARHRLTSRLALVELIASTTTQDRFDLTVRCELDTRTYPKGIKVK